MSDAPIPDDHDGAADARPDFSGYIMEPGDVDFFSDIPDSPDSSGGLPDLSDLSVGAPRDPLNPYSSDGGELNVDGIVEPPEVDYDRVLSEIMNEAESRQA